MIALALSLTLTAEAFLSSLPPLLQPSIPPLIVVIEGPSGTPSGRTLGFSRAPFRWLSGAPTSDGLRTTERLTQAAAYQRLQLSRALAHAYTLSRVGLVEGTLSPHSLRDLIHLKSLTRATIRHYLVTTQASLSPTPKSQTRS